MAAPKVPKPRALLGSEGKRLWRLIWSEAPDDWELDQREIANLELACRLTDRLDRLAREIDERGYFTTGSAGQEVVSRALTEERGLVRDISHLLGTISLPSHQGGAETIHQIRSRQGAFKREAGKAARRKAEAERRARRSAK